MKRESIFFGFGLAVLFGWFFVQVVIKHNGFSYDSGDTAVAQNALFNTLDGRLFYQPFLDVENNFREHISFVQLIFLPFFVLIPHTLTLYGVVLLAYGLCAFGLYSFVRRKTGSFASSLVLSFLFIFHPITAAQLFGPFHVAALAAPFFAVVLWAYYEQRVRWYGFGLFLLFLIPEFIIPTTGILSILALWDRRSYIWILSPLLSAGVLFLLAKYYITIGNGSISRIADLLNPVSWGEIDKFGKRCDYLLNALKSAGWILPLFSRYALVLVPSALIILVISEYGRLTYGAHIVSVIPVVLVFVTLDILLRYPRFRIVVLGLVLVGTALSFDSWFSWYKITPSAFQVEWSEALTYIVDGGSVTADVAVAPHLANRTYLYLADNKELSDYVILKRSKHSLSIEEKRAQGKTLSFYDKISISDQYVPVYREGRIMVAVKRDKLEGILGIDVGESVKTEELVEMYIDYKGE